MVAQSEAQPNPRAQTRKLIDSMLSQRQAMFVLLWKVIGLKPFAPDQPVKVLLTEFCQILVDYIAAAHFGLYQRIADGTERRRPVYELAKDIYPPIARTTQAAVEFNARYERLDDESSLERLPQDLSLLGEALALRVDLEDRLIAVLLSEPVTNRQGV